MSASGIVALLVWSLYSWYLVESASTAGQCQGAAQSRSGARIALDDVRGHNSDIYVVNADGSRLTRLTTGPGDDFSPTWSPDGSRIAFISDRDRPSIFSIYVMDADGSDAAPVAFGAAFVTPVWSPDGRSLAFISRGAIYVQDIDDAPSVARRITDQSHFPSEVAWSRDGRHIAFVSGQGQNLDVYVVNADGSDELRLTRDPGFESDISWSPASNRIAFGRRYLDKDGHVVDGGIFVVDLLGGTETRLTAHEAAEPDWSPDGQSIAYTSRKDRRGQVWVVRSDGSNEKRLTHNRRSNYSPRWSPDGSLIGFVSFEELWTPDSYDTERKIRVMNADGSCQRSVSGSLDDSRFLAWSPVPAE